MPVVLPSVPIVEQEAPENSPSSDIDQIDADISYKQFRFNPPLHNSNLSKVVDLGTTGLRATNFYDERTAPKNYTEKWAKKGLNTLRLGRIIQHHQAPGQVSQMQYRWGFRFLYNPTTVSYVSSRNDSFIIDPRSETNRVISGVFQNFQSISFTVLLDRTPDVMSGIPNSGAYSPALRKGDRDGILRYGTHWDLEALLKICNGEWNLTDRGKTANMGVLMPSNARLILGPGINFYGFVGSVTWKDEMFSANMVPIRTRLDILFRRHVDMSAEQAEKSFPGIASTEVPSEESGSGGTAGSASGGGSAAMANFFLSRVGDTRIIGKKSMSSPATWHSVERACLKNVSWAKRYLGDNVIHSGYSTADLLRRALVKEGKMNSGYNAPAGALFWWGPGAGEGSGHVAVSDGRGNAVNNWGGSKIEKLPVTKMSPRNYSGWSTYASL